MNYSELPTEPFYKHMTYEAAIMCLTSTSFRWSNPSIFNDPHDPNILTSMQGQDFKKIAVFCVSGNHECDAKMWNNPLMWAYYGASNKGIAFEIGLQLFSSSWDHTQPIHFHPIEYLNEPYELPRINIDFITIRHLKRKQECWAHEQEYRFTSSNKLSSVYNPTTKINEYEKFTDVEFNPQCIKRIFLGAQMSVLEIKKIISIINNLPCYKHLQVIKLKVGPVSIEPDSYSIYKNNKFSWCFEKVPKSLNPKEFLEYLDNLTKDVDLETKCNLVTK